MRNISVIVIFMLVILAAVACETVNEVYENEPNTSAVTNMGFTIVSNVEALRSVDGSVYSSVITEGYYKSGDGGNAQYYADRTMKNLEDNGGTVIIGADGTCWRAVYNGPLPLKLFGAVGDGKTDDTAAIKAWLKELKKGSAGYAAAGTYIFKEPLTLPDADDLAIYGDGPQHTVFMYAGNDTDVDLITGGKDSKLHYGLKLSDFCVDSRVKMTGGCGLVLNGYKHTNNIENVSFGRVNGQRDCNLWNGIFFKNCSLTNYTGFEIHVQNEGIMICGVEDSDSGADINIDKGTITFTRVGIHLGGGFGGLYIGQVLIYGCYEVGYLQDNSLCARGNREIIISELCVLDACHSYCALIDDKLSIQCVMQFGAFISGAGWIAPATPGDGLYIKSMPHGRLSVTSNHIKHCKGNGITVGDYTTNIIISDATYIVGNEGWGIYADRTPPRLKSNATFLANVKGDKK